MVKTEFQKLSELRISCATIQIDGTGIGDKEATKMLRKLVPNLPGVPLASKSEPAKETLTHHDCWFSTKNMVFKFPLNRVYL